jgi:hypothetical protein
VNFLDEFPVIRSSPALDSLFPPPVTAMSIFKSTVAALVPQIEHSSHESGANVKHPSFWAAKSHAFPDPVALIPLESFT